jgi:ketosteroid isomerase-like protein
MMADSPADMHRLFADAFNAHDLDALVALYEAEAVLVPQAGQRAIGQSAIREALAGFLSGFQTIELTTRGIVERGDIALLYPDFHLHGTGEDGQPVTLEGHGTEIIRRQAYGGWLFVIDDPFSTA